MLRREKSGKETEESTIDWDDVVFEVDLLKSQEINLDYILELIFEHNKKTKDKETLITEIRRVIRASVGNRAKESLVVDFINETNLDTLHDKANVIDSFFAFAQRKQKEEALELITEEKSKLNKEIEAAKSFISMTEKKLSNEKFVANASPDVVEKERQKLTDGNARLSALEESLKSLG